MSSPKANNFHTYQDWLTWEGSWELINGKAYNMTPAPTSQHQFIVGELHFALRTFFQNRKCYVFIAPFDVFFGEEEEDEASDSYPAHVVQPDLSVVCSKDQISSKGCHGAPTIIIEVLSPTSALKDFNDKFNLYEKYGVQEYWIVDPGNQTVHVFELQDGRYAIRNIYTHQDTVQSIHYPDLQVPLSKLLSMGND